MVFMFQSTRQFTFGYHKCEAERASVWSVGFKVLLRSRFTVVSVGLEASQYALQVSKYESVYVSL